MADFIKGTNIEILPHDFGDDEPAAVCRNCDSYIEDLNGGWHCMNKQSIKYGLMPDADYGCKKFFPDPKRWPEADHD